MVFILCGRTGVGKTTIYKELLKKPELELTPIVPCTTRPMREDEEEGVDYYFMDKDTFLQKQVNKEFMESTAFTVASGETWYYGSYIDSYKRKEGDKLVILNADSIEEVVEKCKKIKVKTCVIHIHCKESAIYDRLVKRKDNYAEVKRRVAADTEAYKKVKPYFNHEVDVSRASKGRAATMVKRIIVQERKWND